MAFFPGIISVVCRQTFSLPHPEQWDMVLGTMAWAGAGGMIKEFFLNPSRVMLPSQLGKAPSFHWMGSVPVQAWQSTVTAMASSAHHYRCLCFSSIHPDHGWNGLPEITRGHRMLTEKHGDSSNLCYFLDTQEDFFVPIAISSDRSLF